MHRSALIVAVCLLCAFPLPAQQQSADDQLQPEELTNILKQEWSFLKEQTDAFLSETATKGEFETTPEFESRIAQRRQVYAAAIMKHIKEGKLDSRQFGVLLKAHLLSYNADKGFYSVACSVAVVAPYDIPSLRSFVPTNPYVVLKDTVVGGYRTSRISLNLKPTLTWSIARDSAREVKNQEGSIYFRVRSSIDITQTNIKDQALLRIIPHEIALINTNTRRVLWQTDLR